MLSIIPINATPNSRFASKIYVDGQNMLLNFELRYNELAGYWTLNISNDKKEPLVYNLPLVPAQNLLEQYEHLQIGRAYLVPAQTATEEWPSRYTLGTEWYLVWGDTDGGDING